MPRKARITLNNVAHHIIQRGNNRVACFYCEEDYLLYLTWLQEYSLKFSCYVHAYVLMTNHVHLLVTPTVDGGLANMMKNLGQRYVQYVNRTYARSGTLWEGRFKSCIANEDRYVLSCYRYIELNPIRAKMVAHPAEYRWSSYRFNAQNESNELLKPNESYLSLGDNMLSRQYHYREMFKSEIDTQLIDQIRAATQSNYALGSKQFKDDIEAAIGRRVSCGVNGRPKSK